MSVSFVVRSVLSRRLLWIQARQFTGNHGSVPQCRCTCGERSASRWRQSGTPRCFASLPKEQPFSLSDNQDEETAKPITTDAAYFKEMEQRNSAREKAAAAPIDWNDYVDPDRLKTANIQQTFAPRQKPAVDKFGDPHGRKPQSVIGDVNERLRGFASQPVPREEYTDISEKRGRPSRRFREEVVTRNVAPRRLDDPSRDRPYALDPGLERISTRFEEGGKTGLPFLKSADSSPKIAPGASEASVNVEQYHPLEEVQDVQILSNQTGLADDYLESVNWEEIEKNDPERRPLEEISDIDPSLSEIAPAPQEFSHNLAAYAEMSPNVRKLVDMGVEVFRMDQDAEVSQTVLTGNWDSRIQPYLDFMKTIGTSPRNMARVLSFFPRFLTVPIPDLEAKREYFRSKKFEDEAIVRIMVKAPLLFALSVTHVDRQLGALQRNFSLSGDEVRDVVTKSPKLVTFRPFVLVKIKLSMNFEMGFKNEEIKHILVTQPKVFRLSKKELLRRFDYLHNVANFEHESFLKFPGVFRAPVHLMKERHLFLKSLKKNQYDPTQPNYVSLHDLCGKTDAEFVTEIAGQSMQVYNEFRKTL